jgi:hypothetical protein
MSGVGTEKETDGEGKKLEGKAGVVVYIHLVRFR